MAKESNGYLRLVQGDGRLLSNVVVAKRFLELWTLDPKFHALYEASPTAEVLARYGLAQAQPEELRYLYDRDFALAHNKEQAPELVADYRWFIMEKLKARDYMSQVCCVPTQPALQAWRQRQQNRCYVQMGMRNQSIIHTPLIFELSEGCSMGCPFCGVAAKGLKAVFRWTEENAALWREILRLTHEFIGDAAGTGTLYYATEPLDNPDYEFFNECFYEEFGVYPQLTTAAAMRNSARTKALLKAMQSKEPTIHRFSVLSLNILHEIFATFTPEELVAVELLPQFVEAPTCNFSNAGRARDNDLAGKKDGAEEAETISCISGFVINMAERSLRLQTPCKVNAEHPTGEIFLEKVSFTDAADCLARLKQMVAQYMSARLKVGQRVSLRPEVEVVPQEVGVEFKFGQGMTFSLGSAERPKLHGLICAKIESGNFTLSEVAESLWEEDAIPPAETIYALQTMFKAGLLKEDYE